MKRSPLTGILLLTLTLLVGCGAEPPPDSAGAGQEAAAPAPSTGEPSATVTILEPADGADVVGPAVAVRLGATGVTIVPAGDMTPGTGHHHLYLDDDVASPGAPIPTVPGRIVHLGTGVSEYVFEAVEPGPHRLIAVVADGVHVPLQPWVTDTVTFTVR